MINNGVCVFTCMWQLSVTMFTCLPVYCQELGSDFDDVVLNGGTPLLEKHRKCGKSHREWIKLEGCAEFTGIR